MKTMKSVIATAILALGACAIPALAGQWTFGGDLRAGFGLFVSNVANSATASLTAIPDVGSILLLGTGLLTAGTFMRVRRRKVAR